MIEHQLHKLSPALRRAIVACAVVCSREAVALLPGEKLPFVGYRIRDHFGPIKPSRRESIFGPDIYECIARLNELGVFIGGLEGPVTLTPKVFDSVAQALPFDKTLGTLRQQDLSEVAARVLTKAVTHKEGQLSVVMATRAELSKLTIAQRERLYLDRVQQAEHMALRTFIETLDDPLADHSDRIQAARGIINAGAGVRKSIIDGRKVALAEREAAAKLPGGASQGKLDDLTLEDLERLQSAVANARTKQLNANAIEGEAVPADDSPF